MLLRGRFHRSATPHGRTQNRALECLRGAFRRTGSIILPESVSGGSSGPNIEPAATSALSISAGSPSDVAGAAAQGNLAGSNACAIAISTPASCGAVTDSAPPPSSDVIVEPVGAGVGLIRKHQVGRIASSLWVMTPASRAHTLRNFKTQIDDHVAEGPDRPQMFRGLVQKPRYP